MLRRPIFVIIISEQPDDIEWYRSEADAYRTVRGPNFVSYSENKKNNRIRNTMTFERVQYFIEMFVFYLLIKSYLQSPIIIALNINSCNNGCDYDKINIKQYEITKPTDKNITRSWCYVLSELYFTFQSHF